MLSERKPASLRICTLLRKPECIKAKDLVVDFVGFGAASSSLPFLLSILMFSFSVLDIPNKWVVGYGLDCAEKWR